LLGRADRMTCLDQSTPRLTAANARPSAKILEWRFHSALFHAVADLAALHRALTRDTTSAILRSAPRSHAAGRAFPAARPHAPQAPGVLVLGASAVRGTQVIGTYRRGDDVPRPSPDIRLH